MKRKTSPYVCHVFVCVNDRKGARQSCADGDAIALRDALKDAVAARGLRGRVRVTRSGCLGLCEQGPNVMLYPQRVWFTGVTMDDLDTIMDQIVRETSQTCVSGETSPAVIRLNRKFLKIAAIELEDLCGHVAQLVEEYREGMKSGHVTEHVYLENVAVLLNEECGFERFQSVLASIDPDKYDSLDTLLDVVREEFRSVLKRAGLAPVAEVFAEQKLQKVAAYVRGGESLREELAEHGD